MNKRYYSIRTRKYHWNALRFLLNSSVLVVFIVMGWLLFSSPTNADAPPQNVIIQKGETLWRIAVRTHPNKDPRKVIEEIRRVNSLETLNITPGQTIIVP
jgi:hypothetical protein